MKALAASTIGGALLGHSVALAIGKFPRLGYTVKFNGISLEKPLPIRLEMPTVSKASEPLLETAANRMITGFRNGEQLIGRNGKVLTMPERESMTTEQGANWLKEMGKEMQTLIDQRVVAGTEVQKALQRAVAAKYLENGFKLVQRNAMKDPRDVVALDLVDPLVLWSDDALRLGNKLSGPALNDEITAQAKASMFKSLEVLAQYKAKTQPPTCFIAGTLVHTENGLVPIEQIKVGDMVLSQPEGRGPLSYKPVTRTFVHEDQEINLLALWQKDVHIKVAAASKQPDDRDLMHFVGVTGNHPFFARKWGTSPNEEGSWTEAQQLGSGSHVKLKDGTWQSTQLCEPVYQTDESHLGWVPMDGGWLPPGYMYDFAENCTTAAGLVRGLPRMEETEHYTPYRTTVYNIEVQDNHTYYVGELGLWVHNKNDPFGNPVLSPAQAEKLQGQDAGRTFYLVEPPLNAANHADVFESQTHGFLQLEGRGIAPATEYRTPFSSGANFEAADALAKMPNGGPSSLKIDAKSGISIYAEEGSLVAIRQDGLALKLAQISEAMKQRQQKFDPNESRLWEFESEHGINVVKTFVEDALRTGAFSSIGGVSNPNWFNPNFYFAKAKPLAPGATQRELPDTVWKYDFASKVFKEVPMSSVLKPAAADVSDLAATVRAMQVIANEAQKHGQNQNVAQAGGLTGIAPISPQDAGDVPIAAKQHWIAAGASAQLLDSATVHVGDLPLLVAAQTIGRQITLSPNGAGWGWFIDTTPETAEEFTRIGTGPSYRAMPSAGAEGQLDLLTVLIHELGHVLGLPLDDDDDVMGRVLDPGMRRLPDAQDAATLLATMPQLMSSNPILVPGGGSAATPWSGQINPELGAGATQWNTRGAVTFADQGNGTQGTTRITLSEAPNAQTSLMQAFHLGANDRYLSFTVTACT